MLVDKVSLNSSNSAYKCQGQKRPLVQKSNSDPSSISFGVKYNNNSEVPNLTRKVFNKVKDSFDALLKFINTKKSNYSNFSKIPGKYSEINGLKTINQYNNDGKLLKTFISKDGKKLEHAIEYDPVTGGKLKDIYYQENGKNIECLIDYDPNTGDRLKDTYYELNSNKLDCIVEYDLLNKNKTKTSYYYKDKVFYVDEE